MKQQDLFGSGPPAPASPARPVVKVLEAEPEWVRSQVPPAEPRAPTVVVPPPPEPVAAWRREPVKKAEPKILSVAELTRALKETIEPAFGRVLVRGEVSGFRGPNARGHLYFALKDDAASIDVKLWQSTAARLKFALKDGLSVIAEGSVDLYEPSGRYSLIVQRLEPAGVGALALAFEQLKAKLMAEGLFGPARKRPRRPIPTLPKRIGVVTSVTGAALRDFLKVLHRRHPRLAVLVADARVQGDGAAEEIARGIRRLGRQSVDVIVITRGGGSAEDLWAFNEEVVARAIFDSPVPVVSAVGHEVDTTLSDFVADLRAPTPSAAAEALAPVLADLQLHLARDRARLRKALERRILEGRHQLRGLLAGLGDPRRALSGRRLHLSESAERMRGSLERALRSRRDALKVHNLQLQQLRPQAQLLATRKAIHQLAARLQSSITFRRERAQLAGLRERLEKASPRPAAQAAHSRLKTAQARLPALARGVISRERTALAALEARLTALDQRNVLARGYAIARTEAGQVVRSVAQVQPGEQLRLLLADGELEVTVVARRKVT